MKTNFPRRIFLHLAAGALALPAVSRIASAQAYPTRPVRLVVGFAAGGVADLFARLIGQLLSERLNQSVIIENRAGAGGNLATEGVIRAIPDGHTLLYITSSNSYNTALYDKLNFDFVRDIVPVASVDRGLGVLVVHPSFPAKTINEFIAYAKANPGKVNMASGGNGRTPVSFALTSTKDASIAAGRSLVQRHCSAFQDGPDADRRRERLAKAETMPQLIAAIEDEP